MPYTVLNGVFSCMGESTLRLRETEGCVGWADKRLCLDLDFTDRGSRFLASMIRYKSEKILMTDYAQIATIEEELEWEEWKGVC